ncbi:MAG TPA: hypothetical protein PLB24_12230 [Comamonas denitrificans]|nr:hypothetical protein [Comamonas denitrificans]
MNVLVGSAQGAQEIFFAGVAGRVEVGNVVVVFKVTADHGVRIVARKELLIGSLIARIGFFQAYLRGCLLGGGLHGIGQAGINGRQGCAGERPALLGCSGHLLTHRVDRARLYISHITHVAWSLVGWGAGGTVASYLNHPAIRSGQA